MTDFAPYINWLEVTGKEDDYIILEQKGDTMGGNYNLKIKITEDKAREIINDLNKLLGDD